MSNTTDEKLIEAIRKDDYVSYNKLFERYYGRLCQYVYRRTGRELKLKKMLVDIFIRWQNIWH